MEKKHITIVSLLILTFLGISILFGGGEEEENKVNWLYDYDEGLRKANAEGKLVLIDFYADWCVWCGKLDQETYNNQEVTSYLNEKLVCIKVDVEKNAGLSAKYSVQGLPTITLLSSDGEEVGRIVGYRPPGQFLEYVKDIVNKYG